MKQFFLDTNIIIDLLADRQPHSKSAIQLFNAAERHLVKLYTSSHSIATTYYLLKPYTEDRALRNLLDHVMDYVHPVSIDLTILKRALKSSHKDFEDAIQIMAASTVSSIHCIVTRNVRDFKLSDIQVLPPDKAVQLF